MLRTIKYRPSWITSGTASVTRELWPFIYKKMLDKLLARALTFTPFDQSSPNFRQMLKIIKSLQKLIATWITFVTQELRPLIYRKYLIICLSDRFASTQNFSQMFTNVEDHNITAKFHYHGNCSGNQEVMALDWTVFIVN